MPGYLVTKIKNECFGCEACSQVCPVNAITMKEDKERFRYPVVNNDICIHCNLCHKVCPCEKLPIFFEEDKTAFGGRNKNIKVLNESTSGGAFSAIVEAWCDENYVIFGSKTVGMEAVHDYILDKKDLGAFRRSKYIQSKMGTSYMDVKKFLLEGKKVLFSGTPCQIAGLNKFLSLTKFNKDNLLLVEVVCEGVPTPLYMDKYSEYIENKYKSRIDNIDYRYKNFIKIKNNNPYAKWDFQVMQINLENKKSFTIDRWFNPFWGIWLNHLMSRPSCYECPFAQQKRSADITLGDLWGVHIYCPELYFNNSGASLIVCNSQMGKKVLEKAKDYMVGHDLDFNVALKYQSPMRNHIKGNANRDEFMKDIESDMNYAALIKKWYNKPSIKLLYQKYIWGNRQKVWKWNILNNGGSKND